MRTPTNKWSPFMKPKAESFWNLDPKNMQANEV